MGENGVGGLARLQFALFHVNLFIIPLVFLSYKCLRLTTKFHVNIFIILDLVFVFVVQLNLDTPLFTQFIIII